MTDFKTLRALDPKSFMDAAQHMNSTSDKQYTGYGDYGTQVALAVEDGAIWKDDAQPDAVTVIGVMQLAFDTSSTLMATAAVTTSTLAIELHTARNALEQVVGELGKHNLVVDDNGHVDLSEERKANLETQRKAGSPAYSTFQQLAYDDCDAFQGLIDLAVQRATDADDACSRLLQQICWTEVPMGTTAEPGLLARAKSANDEAYQTYGQASQLLLRLQTQANTNLQKYENEHENPILGILKGLWEGLTGIWNAAMTIASLPAFGIRALFGDESAKQWFAQLGDSLSQMDLGDLIDLDDLNNGRYGEFIGQNLWWLLPAGKLGDLGKGVKAGAKGLADLGRAARQTLADVREAVARTRPGEIPPARTALDGPELRTTEMEPGMATYDRANGVVQLSPAELEQHRVFIRDGKLYDVNGNPVDTSAASNHWTGQGQGIFVMDKYGNLYLSNVQEVGRFHHSSFLDGQPVAAAGEMEVRNGELVGITDKSGHYKPDPGLLQQAMGKMKQQGVNFDHVNIVNGGH